jgi:hypothetical protein
MESVEEGYAFLCGTSEQKIREGFDYCKQNKIDITHNPYGDGYAAQRISTQLCEMAGFETNKEAVAA